MAFLLLTVHSVTLHYEYMLLTNFDSGVGGANRVHTAPGWPKAHPMELQFHAVQGWHEGDVHNAAGTPPVTASSACRGGAACGWR